MAEAQAQAEAGQEQAGTSNLKAVQNAAAKKPEDITPQERDEATQWFMSEDTEEVASTFIRLNVGGTKESGTEKWVKFKIQIVERERIRDIRRQCRVMVDGEQEVDDTEANARIAAEGLLEPNLQKIVRDGVPIRGQRYMDPVDALRARFAHKPGLIDLIAGKIVELAGYDDKNVQEVKAAGN